MNKEMGKVFDLSIRLNDRHQDCIRLLKNLMMVDTEMVLRVADSLGMTGCITPIVVNGVEYEVPDHEVSKITNLALGGGNGYSGSGKIEAIKALRSLTGMGLKEAKDTVEAWASAATLLR